MSNVVCIDEVKLARERRQQAIIKQERDSIHFLDLKKDLVSTIARMMALSRGETLLAVERIIKPYRRLET